MIIAFSGSDGAGKSTQIEKLIEGLIAEGRRPLYLWSRGGYTPMMVAAKRVILRLLGRRGGQTLDPTVSEDYLTKRSVAIKRPVVARLWLVASILDMALLYGCYVRFQSMLGRAVVCDRYIIDTKIDFERNFDARFNPNGFFWRVLRWFSPQPDVHFVLTVPVDISLQRSAQKNEPFPDTPATLDFRLQRYRSDDVLGRSNVVSLDGTKNIEEIAGEIERVVGDASKRRGRP